MPQVADGRAGDEEREHAGGVRLEVGLRERDGGERDGGDRAHPRGEAVDPVDEVDDVHQRHQPEDRQAVGERRAQVHAMDEREREVGDAHPERDRDHRREQLAHDLEVRGELEQVVRGTHQGDHRGADDDPLRLVVVRQQHQRSHRDRHEDREAAEAGSRLVVEPALTRLVDRPDPPRQRAEDRRGEQRDHERKPEALDPIGDARHAWASGGQARPRMWLDRASRGPV